MVVEDLCLREKRRQAATLFEPGFALAEHPAKRHSILSLEILFVYSIMFGESKAREEEIVWVKT